ncbi:hypothetical protein GCM10009677_33320 [Sphaerisporangium rubeum]|uniref:Uncharacterized protein n=1 Tax=Sphaerisporangium rubeum TaxID=321317 RepID=A0A7X0M7S4_9ACTN|nr:hypothetical protein [Sphaerisporangium rubeum]MBB6474860.1 hypothetical protein [Sphaerisporangium rubeum]
MDEDAGMPDAVRRASGDAGARAYALDGTGRSIAAVRGGLFGGPSAFTGPCADRFQGTLDGLGARVLAARTAHEEIADALRRTVAPIQEEQRTRRELRRAEERLGEAERALATVRTSGPDDVADPAAVARAERDVEQAREEVRRARRRHEEAEQERRRVVRELTVACRTGTVFGPLPAAPGVSAGATAAALTTLLGPRLMDERSVKNPNSLGRKAGGRGVTPQEIRRLQRNGASPREAMLSLLYFRANKSGAVRDGKGWALGFREYDVTATVGRVGERTGARFDARTAAYLLRLNPEANVKAGPVRAKAALDARILGAEASTANELSFGKKGGRLAAGGELFAGARTGVPVEVELGPVKAVAKPEGWLGAGLAGNFDAEFHDGKLKIKGAAGLAAGLGAKVAGGAEIDVAKLARDLGDGVADNAKKLVRAFP